MVKDPDSIGYVDPYINSGSGFASRKAKLSTKKKDIRKYHVLRNSC
jgi:hypothetical protein